jgi:hypothetical protein
LFYVELVFGGTGMAVLGWGEKRKLDAQVNITGNHLTL